MGRAPSINDCQTAIAVLGLPLHEVAYIIEAQRVESAVIRWREVLSVFRGRWKKLSFELHPDRGGSQEAFVRASNAWLIVQDEAFARCLWHSHRPATVESGNRVTVTPGQTVVVHSVFVGVANPFTSTSATTNVTSTGSIWFGDSPFIRRT